MKAQRAAPLTRGSGPQVRGRLLLVKIVTKPLGNVKRLRPSVSLADPVGRKTKRNCVNKHRVETSPSAVERMRGPLVVTGEHRFPLRGFVPGSGAVVDLPQGPTSGSNAHD